MRLVDLRSSAPAPTLQVVVQASAAAEMLRLLGVLYTEAPGEYDVGKDRIEALRATLPSDLVEEIDDLRCGDQDYFLLPLLAAGLPDPGGVEELLTALDQDPASSWRLLLGHAAQSKESLGPELAARVLAGDDDAVAQAREELADEDDDEVRALLAIDPEEHGRRVARIVERFDAEVWQAVAAEAMGPIKRDVEHRTQRLAAGADPQTVIVEATNGYEPPEDAGLRRVVLLPSYWMRPWLVIGHAGADTEVISTVVADEFLVLPSEEPPPALVKLAKALADESRLRLLRRMASGPISLSEATEALDVTKATAHHHLSILRQAGLVAMRGTGRATRYTLRSDPADAARDALSEYCCR